MRLISAGEALDRLRPRVLFSDVDGTLVGKAASFFHGLDGEPTLAAAEALFAAHRAGLEIVLVSGRTRAQLFETGRLLGLRDAIAELGVVLVTEGVPELRWGATPPGLGETPRVAIERSGALDLLLESFAGKLEPHAPWDRGREGTALLRGRADRAKADALLREAGFDWLRLRDNGRLHAAYPHLGPGEAHAYHLTPSAVTKADSVAHYLRRRGISPDEAAAIGDSPADLELADVAGAMFMVANGAWAVERDEALQRRVITTGASAGDGWAEAVSALVARM
jgi:hydroxymethylpyrimidine pyrophosphatase-like HAD family hydrolase